MELLPEDERVTRLTEGLISAKPLIDAVRYLAEKQPLFISGILSPTPVDKFVFQILLSHYYGMSFSGSGTATLLPPDVIKFITAIQIAHQAKENEKAKELENPLTD